MTPYHKIAGAICISLLLFGCSSDDAIDVPLTQGTVVDTPTTDDQQTPDNDTNTGDDTNDTTTGDDNAGNNAPFSFDANLVMEHSYNTGGCTPGPCDTIDTSLSDVMDNGQPDDQYFYRSDDGTALNLKCQLDEGRRTEFKQVSEGPLTTPSRIEFEATYFDIPARGMTIAQVHNRGASRLNKPFFRLELHHDELETVVRRDPVVSSDDTTFSSVSHPFANGADYNEEEPLNVVIEKANGVVHLLVVQGGVTLIDDTYAPESGTNWIEDSGIANGYYLKAGIYNPKAAHTEEIEMQYTRFSFVSEDQN